MLPDGDALLWRSSLVLASGRSDDSSVHFPTHTRHSQASLIQEQVGTGAVVIVIPRAKLYGFHVVDHPKGGDGAGIPSEPSWRDVGTVPATEPSQRQRAAGEQPAGAEDSQESTQDSTRPSDRVQIEMSGPNRVKRIVPEG
ncbi:hypothetical protein NEUTE1DRAFT_98409 [Neurospora tetrasperma FGSC 2508]|uniref:Uncharacterized protein n=1 Tax=Neurospora tetrasperma (strain FGSC 2508 / ATCC MYA-4615 / P0657) TaxID=510951 RepID=F8MCI2_NEUT8|nr:uncharacterized protein NEUTE1DRAFT_98409 [Neurospora tetrasperma FGSC 2508]EGO61283.1 hypothetical protein NEUTE1DRAFT_98409 [Neurospora tetrasperma FGSC 2508]